MKPSFPESRRGKRILGAVTVGVVLLAVLLAVTALVTGHNSRVATDGRPQRPPLDDFARARERAAASGAADVIVGLRVRFTAEGRLSPGAVTAQRARIAAERARVVAIVGAAGGTQVRAYRTLPYVALSLPVSAVDQLRRVDAVSSIGENRVQLPADTSGARLVEAAQAASLRRTGAGQTIAIVDSGVDRSHVFLQQRDGGPSKVVSEACYSDHGNCPGGVKTSTAVGSGAPCTYAPTQCYHGTFVAGIAAGRGSAASGVDYSGVARGATLISVQVYSRFTGDDCHQPATECGKIVESDVLKALERVYMLRNTFHTAAVNLSFGRFGSSTNCDGDPTKSAIDNLRSVGIATVIASGNEHSTTEVSIPSCVSTAITVGSSTLKAFQQSAEGVPDFSNSSPLVELLGPGESVESSTPGGGFASADGTSFAAPHIAGAFAILRALSPTSSVTTLLYDLQSTGKLVTDGRNNVTVPRIRVLAASIRIAETGLKGGGAPFGPGWDASSNGVGMARRAGAQATGTIRIADIPEGSTIRGVYLYWMTLGGADPTARLAGVRYTGVLQGAASSCQDINRGQPARTYRAAVPLAAVPGNGNYVVSEIRGGDGEGASLLVVFTPPGVLGETVVYIKNGASTAVVQPRSFRFNGLYVPNAPLRAKLHLGVGNGQSMTENPVFFGGASVTPANFFSGRDGSMWDDDEIPIPISLLPSGTTSRTVTFGGGAFIRDCVTAAYGALVITRP
jgi:subtilisin family serine protease